MLGMEALCSFSVFLSNLDLASEAMGQAHPPDRICGIGTMAQKSDLSCWYEARLVYVTGWKFL